jgi:hypothetical protein
VTVSPSPQTSGPAASTAAGQTVAVDPALLAILPDEVGGVRLEPAPETAAEIAGDPTIAAPVEALAMALAVASGSSSDQDIAIASVVRLRPDIFSAGFFRGWRDSYDDAACAQAGGVAGNAEAEIDGRTVFIGSCVNGAFTYHVRYGEDVIVAVTSVGERRFGEEVVSNLGD